MAGGMLTWHAHCVAQTPVCTGFDKEPALEDDSFLSSSLNKAKKQMDGLKGMLGGLFGGGSKK
jgi:hypothetical protein